MATHVPHIGRRVMCSVVVLLLLVFCGIPTPAANTAPTGPRAHTWALSPADFAAGDFAQTAFEAGQLRAVDARGGSFSTPAHRAPFPFTAAGVDWRAELAPGDAVALDLRLNRDGQTWSAWQPIGGELQGERWFGENLVTLEGAQWLQARLTLRGNARVEALTLTAIDASGAPTLTEARAKASPLAVSLIGVPAPTVISRAAWGADESLMTWPPQYATARKIVIHHTVTSGGDNPIAEVQAIYYFHAITRGWGDIGYNYLVDKFGNIYEGRAGGLDVIAGHTYSYNTGSVGFGNLGDYSSAAPTAAMRDINAALAAWYGGRNFIHPLESSLFNDRVTPNITGHRDYAATACPGAAFYAQLPAIRARAWDILRAYTPPYAAAFLNHDTPSLMLTGSTVEVRHTLRNTGTNTWYYLADPGSGTPYRLGYHWYDASGQQYVQPPEEDHRTSLSTDVPYGAAIAVPAALLTAPRAPGVYTLKWDMVHEGVTWFANRGSPTLDLSITVTYPATITGVIRDNRGAGVNGAQVALADGTRVSSNAAGAYTLARLFPGSHTLQAREPGEAHLPNGDPVYDLQLRGGESASVVLTLIPFDNVLSNWGFEAGLDGWTAAQSPADGFVRGSDFGHTGRASAELVALQNHRVELQQAEDLPTDVLLPTLSLRYAAPGADSDDVFSVVVETASGAVVSTLPYGAGWQHWWTGVTAAPGEHVTVTLRLQADGDTQLTTLYLDEVTLGSGGAYGWRYHRMYLPLVLRDYDE